MKSVITGSSSTFPLKWSFASTTFSTIDFTLAFLWDSLFAKSQSTSAWHRSSGPQWHKRTMPSKAFGS